MIRIEVGVNAETGEVEVSLITGRGERKQRNKGKSLLTFPKDYTVIDTETTGFDPEYDEIIEFAGIRVRNDKEVERFQTLIKPTEPIDSFITELTGITNTMLEDAPSPKKAIPKIFDFIGDDILIAHNAHFDINFLYDYFEEYLNETLDNDFVCTMRLSRRVFPDVKNHKLITLCKAFNLNIPTHRSIQDTISALDLFNLCEKTILDTIGMDEFYESIKRKSSSLKANDINATVDTFDPNHPLYGKNIAFTGTLSKMLRRDAMQLVANLGGKCSDNVTKKTNYLIMGIQDYSKFADGEKSRKTKRAEELILGGQDLEIISENIFYELVLED